MRLFGSIASRGCAVATKEVRTTKRKTRDFTVFNENHIGQPGLALKVFCLKSAEFSGDVPESLSGPALTELIGIAVLLFLEKDGTTGAVAGDDD